MMLLLSLSQHCLNGKRKLKINFEINEGLKITLENSSVIFCDKFGVG